MPAPEGLKEWSDQRGRRRITWKGRKGFPVMLRKDETAQQGYERTLAKDAEKIAAQVAAETAAGAQGTGAGAAPVDEPKRARPPGSDPRPKGGRPIGRPRPTDTEILQVFEEILVLPAIPFGMPVHDPSRDEQIQTPDGPRVMPGFRPRCEFCRDHFIAEGPKAAAELVTLSQQSDPLRRVLEQVTTAWKMVSVAGVIGAYLGKPAMHHLAPEPVLAGVGPAIGVPPRPPAIHRGHAHAHAGAATATA